MLLSISLLSLVFSFANYKETKYGVNTEMNFSKDCSFKSILVINKTKAVGNNIKNSFDLIFTNKDKKDDTIKLNVTHKYKLITGEKLYFINNNTNVYTNVYLNKTEENNKNSTNLNETEVNNTNIQNGISFIFKNKEEYKYKYNSNISINVTLCYNNIEKEENNKVKQFYIIKNFNGEFNMDKQDINEESLTKIVFTKETDGKYIFEEVSLKKEEIDTFNKNKKEYKIINFINLFALNCFMNRNDLQNKYISINMVFDGMDNTVILKDKVTIKEEIANNTNTSVQKVEEGQKCIKGINKSQGSKFKNTASGLLHNMSNITKEIKNNITSGIDNIRKKDNKLQENKKNGNGSEINLKDNDNDNDNESSHKIINKRSQPDTSVTSESKKHKPTIDNTTKHTGDNLKSTGSDIHNKNNKISDKNKEPTNNGSIIQHKQINETKHTNNGNNGNIGNISNISNISNSVKEINNTNNTNNTNSNTNNTNSNSKLDGQKPHKESNNDNGKESNNDNSKESHKNNDIKHINGSINQSGKQSHNKINHNSNGSEDSKVTNAQENIIKNNNNSLPVTVTNTEESTNDNIKNTDNNNKNKNKNIIKNKNKNKNKNIKNTDNNTDNNKTANVQTESKEENKKENKKLIMTVIILMVITFLLLFIIIGVIMYKKRLENNKIEDEI
ncbi:hypothetical protein EHP00_815 [Ecytonucleospora hepatopenaei]|uniref:Uncharacterized protein n=1 Tax=Ecytonucleospora hepatopenaei TaxID=646526 RepID=A0A1W0E7Q3_9MICR|nr:hypothetical protein EHP00_815 [Ecytonucleospora hepatopenaei]